MEKPKCIFCPAELDATTKPEHVLQKALGGKKTTTRVVCSKCNNTFGSGIDKHLAEQYEFIRGLLQLRSGDGSLAPTRRNIKVGEDTLDLKGDGSFKLVGKPFKVIHTEDGQTKIEFNGGSIEQFERLIPNIAAAARISEEELRRLVQASNFTTTESRPGPSMVSLQFGTLQEVRAVTKSCLVLWATKVGATELRHARYDAARRFVMAGDEEFFNTAIKADSRRLPFAEPVEQSYGPVFNLIYVESDAAGRVTAHMTLYNLMAYSIILCAKGAPPSISVAMASNPLTLEWSDQVADTLTVPFGWLHAATFDETAEEFSARADAIMHFYYSKSREREVARIVKSSFEELGVAEDAALTEAHIERLLAQISRRLAHYMMGMPLTNVLTPQQVQARLSRARRTETPL